MSRQVSSTDSSWEQVVRELGRADPSSGTEDELNDLSLALPTL